jgi:hypothetical protein
MLRINRKKKVEGEREGKKMNGRGNLRLYVKRL